MYNISGIASGIRSYGRQQLKSSLGKSRAIAYAKDICNKYKFVLRYFHCIIKTNNKIYLVHVCKKIAFFVS